MTAPCHNCEDRHAGCHADCVRYAEFSKLNAREREERRKKMKADKLAEEMLVLASIRRKKEKHER